MLFRSYAYGLRNPHRIFWDAPTNTLLANDIGDQAWEEINVIVKGGNYGWMAREGYWENGMFRPGGALNELYPLPASVLDGTVADAFTYPVAIYDHDEGRAISGGFAYHGSIEALEGKFKLAQERAEADREGMLAHLREGGYHERSLGEFTEFFYRTAPR